MAETVRVEFACKTDSLDLVEGLARNGLIGEFDGARSLLVSRSGAAEAGSVGLEACRALESWLAARGVPLVPTPLGGNVYLLRPPTA